MAFNAELPEWNKTAAAPPQTNKDNGWAAEDYPPASWFNWFFNVTYLALQELQQEAAPKDTAQMVKLSNDDGSSQTIPDGTDIKTFAGTGFFIGQKLVNMPNNDQSYFRFIINPSGPTSRTLIAVNTSNQMYTASVNGGAWVDWEKVTTDKKPTWSNLTLQNGWVSYGGGDPTPQYTKIGNKVIIKGTIKSGVVDQGTVLFTLPSGYRPNQRATRVISTSSGSAAPAFVRIFIETTGSVTLNSTGASSTWVSLDGIDFVADGN